MTRDEAVAAMRRLLAFNNSLDADILIDALKYAQRTLERMPDLPWFLQTEISSTTTTADEERVPLPDDFLIMHEDDGLWRYDATEDPSWVELVKDEMDVLRYNYRSEGTGAPEAYSLDKSYFRLFPTPDLAYTLKMTYHKADTVLDTNVENEWLTYVPDLLIGMGVKYIGMSSRDRAAVEVGAALEVEQRKLLEDFLISRETANRTPLQMGGPD